MGISSEQRPTGRSTCRPGRMLAASVQRQADPRQPENITIHLNEHIRSVQGKGAMKMKCSASDTLRRAPRTSRSETRTG